MVFITGADAFAEIASWRHYPALLDRCHFAVVSRPGMPAADLGRQLPALADRMVDAGESLGATPGVHLVSATTAPVSSTEVRRRLAAGHSVAGLVPDPVATYITRHGLYGSGGGWPDGSWRPMS
jgi:nicotinate-nucleotide adenylyltransferase